MSNHNHIVPTKKPPILNNHQIKRIPSLELQTIAFMASAREKGIFQEIRLSWNGFYVSLGFDPTSPIQGDNTLKNVFNIFDVYVPPQYRMRGWMTGYLQLCQQLAGGTLLIFGSLSPLLRHSLQRNGFEQVNDTYWIIQA